MYVEGYLCIVLGWKLYVLKRMIVEVFWGPYFAFLYTMTSCTLWSYGQWSSLYPLTSWGRGMLKNVFCLVVDFEEK